MECEAYHLFSTGEDIGGQSTYNGGEETNSQSTKSSKGGDNESSTTNLEEDLGLQYGYHIQAQDLAPTPQDLGLVNQAIRFIIQTLALELLSWTILKHIPTSVYSSISFG